MDQSIFYLFELEPSSISDLAGYENKNYLVETAHQKWVLKEYPYSQDLMLHLQAECEYLAFLSNSFKKYPSPLKSRNNKYLEIVNDKIYRVCSYIEGGIFDSIKGEVEFLPSLGKELAELNQASKDYYDPKLLAKVNNHWDLQYLQLSKPYFEFVSEPRRRKYLDYFFMKYEHEVLPKLGKLRKSVIHGDINEFNILVDEKEVIGFFDFGDVSYGPLINEVAVAATYVALSYDDTIEAVKSLVSNYHLTYSLTEEEVQLIYYLIPARLIQSLANAAYSSHQQPENKDYITTNSADAWNLIEKWISINPIYFSNELLKACNFPLEIYSEQDFKNDIAKRNQLFSKSMSVSSIAMHSAAFQYMYGRDGKTYLDLRNNIPHVGHNHPKVVEANTCQQSKLNTNTRYVYPELNEYAERLLKKFPSELNRVFFVNSGSAASDLAMRLAKVYSNSDKMVVLEEGYHGNTYRSIEISHYKYGSKGGFEQKENVIQLPMPWNYKHVYKENAQDVLLKKAKELLSKEEEVSGFIAEPIIGCGGQLELPQGYLKELYPIIRTKGGLCISDEVQTGFARLGDVWWGFEQHDVVPDVVVLGKCIGNGHPMAAVVTTEEVADRFANGMEFFSSFGGNPVSCVNGMAVLEVIEEENLKENALEMGMKLREGMRKIAKDYSSVGAVRGNGLFLGVELVKSHDSTEANTNLCQHIKQVFLEHQILVGSDGPFDHVLKIKPPLCFSNENVEQFLQVFEEALKKGKALS